MREKKYKYWFGTSEERKAIENRVNTEIEEPRYDIICLELRPGTKFTFEVVPKEGLVGIRTVNAVQDNFLRKKFWPTWDTLVEEATKLDK